MESWLTLGPDNTEREEELVAMGEGQLKGLDRWSGFAATARGALGG